MKKFKLTITVSYYNDESDDLEKDFQEEMKREGRENITAQVVEVEGCHISGTVTDTLEVADGDDVKKAVEDHIREYGLGGECFSLADENGVELFTEEDEYFN